MRNTRGSALVALVLMVAGCDGPAPAPDAGPGDDAGMDGGGDVCEGRTTCPTAGTSCSGDSLVTCAPDADGCLIRTTTDCGASDQVCDDSGATAACVDPCSLIPTADRCETAGARACDGDTLEVCTADADGCLVLERTDCTGGAGGTCDDSGEMPVCADPPDPCDGTADACTTEGASCSGDTLVVCAPNAFGCLVETSVDCTSRAGGACDSSGTTPTCTADDPCAGLTECTTAGTACDGPELVTCAPDAFGCLIETRTTCTDVTFGFCDADGTPPACSTAATDPCMDLEECGTEPGRSCSDTSTLSVCAPNAFGCFVATDTDCGATSEVCSDASGTATCVDPCSLVTTCASSLSCDGDALVTCEADSNGCLVESDRTTCADTCDPAGTASCVTTACAPARPGFLNCGSGTVTGDTAMGAALNDGGHGDCGIAGEYPGNEEYWRFRNDDATRMAVRIVATPITSSADFDLFVLDPGDGSASCDSGTLSCLDWGDSFSGTETVDFNLDPGALAYVIYDVYSSTTTTTDYTLAITCTPIVCGDSAITGDETCDDGNTGAGDGCSDTCQVEPGWSCTGGTCTLVCGNGTLDASEECDDGNTGTGDGCSDTCQVEAGWACEGAGAGSCVEVADNAACASARAVTSATTITGENTRAGGPRPTASGCGTGTETGATLYYEVTIPAGQKVDIALTYGTASDLLIFSAPDCSAASCDQVVDYISGAESLAIVNPSGAGITRVVGVRPYDPGDGGTYDIAFTYTAAASNSTCATATVIPSTTDTTLTGESTDGGGPRPIASSCGTESEISDTLYYSVTVPPSQALDISLHYGTATDLLIFVQSACSDAGCGFASDLLPPGEEAITIPNSGTTPVTYLIGVGPYEAGVGGTFDIAFSYSPGAGDTCAAAPVVGPGTYSGSTTGLANDYQLSSSGCTSFGSPGPDAVYAVSLAAGETLDATVTPAGSFDVALYAVTDCSMAESSCVDGSDSGFGGDPESISYTATAPTTLYLIVDSWSSTVSGAYSLEIAITP